MFWCAFVFFILMTNKYVACQSACPEQNTCGQCIGYASEICSWCTSTDIKGKNCQPAKTETCNANATENPQNVLHIITNEPMDSKTKVHIAPQKINLNIRPGQPIEFNVTYELSKDYPLDIYFLLDGSYSMGGVIKELRSQVQSIKEELSRSSTNVRFGYGIFLDKPALPRMDKTQHSTALYAFKHLMNLTDNAELGVFNTEGSNFDQPEAGLDALLQVMVCKDQIGWRREARKIIAMFTDSSSHTAGSGNVVGAFRKHDMQCHLDNDGLYNIEKSITLDYPSLHQINYISKREDIQILFIASKNFKEDYETMATVIQQAKYIDLASKFLAKIISDSYKEVLRFPQLYVNAPSNLDIKMDPPCKEQPKNKQCELKNYKSIQVTMSVTLLKCPEERPLKMEFSVMGLKDKLLIDVEPLCKCACDRTREIESLHCNQFGTLVCGVCECTRNRESRKGRQCECVAGTDIDEEKCIKPKDNHVCSNRGDCICGKCENCRENSHGDYCQYTDLDCSSMEGKVCAGNGKCRYGKCVCDPNWTGDDCTCTTLAKTCIDPYSQKVCSENGQCECGKCKCSQQNNADEMFNGEFCDNCINCAEKRCKKLETFAECIYNATANKNDKNDCYKEYKETDVKLTLLNKTDINEEEYRQYAWCRLARDDGILIFRHKSKFNILNVLIQSQLEVLPKAEIWIPITITIVVTLLVGILTVLARKILLDIHDARAYNQFESEIKALGLEDCTVGMINSKYVPPIQEFTNPTYHKN